MNRIEFYQMIGTGIRRYLPMGYQEYQVHIKEAEISEKKNALLVLEKEGVKNMPVMSLEPDVYKRQVEEGYEAVGIEVTDAYYKLGTDRVQFALNAAAGENDGQNA